MQFFALFLTLSVIVISVASERLWTSKVNGKSVGTLESHDVTSGICDANVKQQSGYYKVKGDEDKNYFFWRFDSRNKPETDPLVIWLTGGPGCSSILALTTENGPCTPTEDGQSTVNNPYSWNNNANIMWIDQPANVGYSYGAKDSYDHNQDESSLDLFNFLQAFFQDNKEFQGRDFYVFGESYGGHFVPAISKRIWDSNNDLAEGDVKINLVGFGIGNGLTDPKVQYQYYPEMAMNNTYGIQTVSEKAYEGMLKAVPHCTQLAEACEKDTTKCVPADDYCNLKLTTPYYSTGLNPYDIRKECGDNSLCYNMTSTEVFLNLESTKADLHVSTKVKTWQECNTPVNAAFAGDWMRQYASIIAPMLESGVRSLIYAGDCDFICNWMGNKAWTKALDWTGKEAFNAAADKDWTYDKDGVPTKGGIVRGANGLTFLQVFEAGHMVPMDQPQAALALYETFIQGKSFD